MTDDFSLGCGCGAVLVGIVALAGGAYLFHQYDSEQADAQAAEAADVALDVWQARVEALEIRVDELESQLEDAELERDLLRMRVDDAESRIDDLEGRRWR